MPAAKTKTEELEETEAPADTADDYYATDPKPKGEAKGPDIPESEAHYYDPDPKPKGEAKGPEVPEAEANYYAED